MCARSPPTFMRGEGDIRHESQTLIQPDLGPLVLTRLESAGKAQSP